MLRMFGVFALTAMISFSSHAQATLETRAKDVPEFMKALEELREVAPDAYELLIKKVEEGATLQEIRDYIGPSSLYETE